MNPISIFNKPESGYCQCNCGNKTPIAKKTRTSIGHKKGKPIPFINGHNRRKQIQYVIEDRGYKTPCWIWQLGLNTWGYGVMHTSQGSKSAHRIFYKRVYPELGAKHLDHLCRNRNCVNPEHLEPVTCEVNIQRGDRTKLTAPEVRAIRKMLASGYAQKEIGLMFNVVPGTIGAIARGHTWKNV